MVPPHLDGHKMLSLQLFSVLLVVMIEIDGRESIDCPKLLSAE